MNEIDKILERNKIKIKPGKIIEYADLVDTSKIKQEIWDYFENLILDEDAADNFFAPLLLMGMKFMKDKILQKIKQCREEK